MSAAWPGWVDATEVARFFLFFGQCIVVFWAGFNLLRDEKTARTVLWWFVLACLVRAALPLVGIGRTAYQERWTGGERVTAFGQDPHFRGTLLATALITLIGPTPGPATMARPLRWAPPPPVAPV